MSIHGLIQLAKDQGRLFEMEPERPTTWVRRIVADPEVHKLSVGPWKDEDWEERCGRLQGDYFDRFLNGGRITVALDPGTEDDDCYFKRLYPIENEVWTIRSVDPSPGIRVFGSFAETDVFVATNWRLRKELGAFGSPEWAVSIALSRATWVLLFGDNQEPKRGALNDYIRRQAVSLDAIP